MVGKYVTLVDSYVSVNEALKHASASIGRSVNIDWIDSETLNGNIDQLHNFDGVLIPGGFGTRGSEGNYRYCYICTGEEYTISWNLFWFSTSRSCVRT